jgi:hypothetical protein
LLGMRNPMLLPHFLNSTSIASAPLIIHCIIIVDFLLFDKNGRLIGNKL